MNFHTLEVKNFGSIKQLTVDFAKQGLTLIAGRNDDAPKADSNGAGKSFILEALCWCLWGKTIRGGEFNGDGVVNRHVGQDCEVSVSFEESGDTYFVARARKHTKYPKPNDLHVYKGSVDITQASMAKTQELLTDLLGVDFDTFCVMMPGAGLRASEMTDREVKELLERLLQTQVLGNAYDVVKQRLKETQLNLSLAIQAKQQLLTALEECEVRLDEVATKSSTYEQDKADKLAELRAKLAEVQDNLASQDAHIQKAAGVEQTINNLVGKITAAKQTHQTRVTTAAIAVKAKQQELQAANRRLLAVQINQDKLTSTLKALPIGGDCPVCMQQVTDDHVADATAKITEALDLYQSQADEIAEEIADLQQRLDDEQVTNTKLIESAARQVQLLVDDKARFDGILQEYKLAVAVKAQLERQQVTLLDQQTKLQEEENPFASLIAQTAEDAYEKAAKASREYAKVKDLTHTQAILEYWATGFGPRGVRSFMLEHVTPLLNTAAKKYADLLTAGEMSVTFHTQQRQKSGKIVEKFNIVVEHLHGSENYSSSSMGEKSRANLVIAFALGDLAALRANKTVNFRFLDEPFESVDESGTDAIVALLNDQKDRFDTVFVITHQDHFKQLFPNKLTVVKRDGVTMLEEDHG